VTANDLRTYLNGISKSIEYPIILEVDAETYADVCQEIFNWHVGNHLVILVPGTGCELTHLALGQNNGIMFKNVELILRR
jgi:hypothetical protein